jgi:thiamine biosynthesis protein ThiS
LKGGFPAFKLSGFPALRLFMRITLNGDPHDLPAPLTVGQLLEQLKIDPRVVAVEVDRVIVKRDRYGRHVIADGAEVEIVTFVGGGCR